MQQHRNTPWRAAFGGLIALAAALGLGRFAYTPILPAMMEGLHLSKAAVGLIASFNFAGYLVGALLAAAPQLPGSRRNWLLGTLAVNTATTIGMGLTTHMSAFLVLRFIGGAASAFVMVFAAALVFERLATARRPGLAAVLFAGVGVGIVISAMVTSWMLRAGANWSQLWLVIGAVTLVAIPAVAWLLPDHPVATAVHVSEHPVRTNIRGLIELAVAYGLFGFGYVVTATFLVAIIRSSPAMRPAEPLVWLIVGATAAPSVAGWTWCGQRLGLLHAYAMACMLEAVGVGISALWHSIAAAVITSALLGGTFVGLTALGLAAARTMVTGDPRKALALMTAAFGVGQMAGPALAGMLSERFGGYALPSLLAAAGLLAAATIVSPLRERFLWRPVRSVGG